MAALSSKALLLVISLLLASSFVSAHLGHSHEAPETDEQTTDTATGTATTTSAAAQAVSPPVDLRSGKIISNKVGALIVIFAVPFLACLVTYFIRASYQVITYGNLFSAGLFVTLAMLHLVDDAASGLSSLTSSTYPWAYLLVVAGYFFTMLADIIVHAILRNKEEVAKQRAQDKNAELADRSIPSPPPKKSCCQTKSQSVDEESATHAMIGGPSYCCDGNCKCTGENCQCPQEMGGNAKPGLGDDRMLAAAALQEAAHKHDLTDMSAIDVLLLALALCFHAVFEGLAIGLSGTSRDVWKTTGTILLHKIFEGLALGASLMLQNPARSFWSLMPLGVGFAISAPVGLAIGIILDSTTPTRTALWFDAIGNGFAAGVFIYVALTHIIGKFFKESCQDKAWTPLAKWAACALGVMTMALIQMKHD